MACVHGFGIAIAAAAATYAWAALLAVCRRLPAPPTPAADAGQAYSVSVLKPLRGADPNLYENLRSFCLQAHPDYQLVFGVRDAEDPAIAIVPRLRAEFPRLTMTLVVNRCSHGRNPKVSNLINMLPFAQHDLLVLSDSDVSVPTDYLARVTAPLAVPGTGIVTCLYRGIAGRGVWSHVGRLFVDDWFIPSVRLAYAFNWVHFAFGATIAVRRDTLQLIGGFEALRDRLADDFWLGELTRRRGLRTVVSDLVVGTQISETRLSALWAHELRWLRTIRSIAPSGFAMLWVCFTLPVLLLGLALAPGAATAGLLLFGLIARLLLHFVQRRGSSESSSWWDVLSVLPRDILNLFEWAASLVGRRVTWRGQVLDVRYDSDAMHEPKGSKTK
ncbi:MAG: bacteriohopanetetrol glucosamine biosynthesis glycosyltransferase HpnI [Rhodanobacteraceae bacterium]